MFFGRFKYLLAAFAALTLQSITMPAQTSLPQLDSDPCIRRGKLGCGATYYMVTDPVKKGYASLALVQKADSITQAKRQGLSTPFLSRMGVAPGPDGYITQKDGATIYQFNDLRFYRPEVLDSVLLYTFTRMAASKAPQALIVSGDIDATELKKKMDIFSMLVSRLPDAPKADAYQWQARPAPAIHLTEEGPASVKVGYSGARVPEGYMNTAQAIVTDLFSMEFRLLLEHRLDHNLRLAGIPYSSIDFFSRRSSDGAGDEHYSVQVCVAPENLDAAFDILSTTIAELDAFGPSVEEFMDSKQVLLPSIERKAFSTPSAGDYVNRCIANYLYGAQLAPYTEPLRYFARKRVSDSTETQFFAAYADALLTGTENLSLTYGPVQQVDTVDTEADVLFRYNLHYLLGGLAPSGEDYRWQRADTSGLEVSAPRIRIKSEKTEAVSGGTLWTFSNDLKVIYKQVKGSGRFSYALQLSGGLSQISNLKEGEGAYVPDLLFVNDVAGIPGTAFRDMLLSNGVSMESSIELNNLIISGDAPSGKLSLVLKSLLGLANARNPRPEAFLYYKQCQTLKGADDPLLFSLTPGYKYITQRKPSALTADTQKKAQKYFDDRFARMNDGVLILSGDLSPEAAKRHLLHYLGAFRVMRGTASRKSVDMRTLSGTQTVSGTQPGVRVIMDAEYPVTVGNFYASQIALEAIKLSLVSHLADYGFTPDVRMSYMVHPQERFRIDIFCSPVPEGHLPAKVTDVTAERALTAVRAALREVAERPVEEPDLQAWKAKTQANVAAALESPDNFVSSLLVRYARNKDVLSGYKETISGITAAQVNAFLQAMAAGGRIESYKDE